MTNQTLPGTRPHPERHRLCLRRGRHPRPPSAAAARARRRASSTTPRHPSAGSSGWPAAATRRPRRRRRRRRRGGRSAPPCPRPSSTWGAASRAGCSACRRRGSRPSSGGPSGGASCAGSSPAAADLGGAGAAGSGPSGKRRPGRSTGIGIFRWSSLREAGLAHLERRARPAFHLCWACACARERERGEWMKRGKYGDTPPRMRHAEMKMVPGRVDVDVEGGRELNCVCVCTYVGVCVWSTSFSCVIPLYRPF